MDAAWEANLYRVYEKQVQDAARQRPVLPVTIITGFLGAGKTTLLKKILRSKHNLRIAAVVNDYGSVDHDGEVVERDGQTDSVDKLAGGCVCCQGSLGQRLEQRIGDLLQQPDHAEDRYDYLVIETSGVSDPESIIQALDKTFGKLTRARLDSVVAVVDSDYLLNQTREGQTWGVSLERQLRQADVILLNKSDLLDEKQLSELTASVSSVNPAARITSCSYGRVALHEVLDVEAPRTDIQGVSHERIATHLYVSSVGGNLRKASSSSSSKTTHVKNNGLSGRSNENAPAGHLREDGLEQVTFTSKSPLSLARFQDWVSCGMPRGVVRAKGLLAFDEDRLTRSVFNMSGRRRLSFEQDGVWEGPLRLHLVVIGVGIDKQQVLSALEGLCVSRALSSADRSNGYSLEAQTSRMLEILETDMLFDQVPSYAKPACPAHVVRFRFTGTGAYGMPPSQLSVKFGVNLNSVNRAILRRVNSGALEQLGNVHVGTVKSDVGAFSSDRDDEPRRLSSDTLPGSVPRIFLTCQENVHISGAAGEEDCLVLRFALGGSVSLSEAWPSVVKQTRGVMSRELGHIHFCTCFS